MGMSVYKNCWSDLLAVISAYISAYQHICEQYISVKNVDSFVRMGSNLLCAATVKYCTSLFIPVCTLMHSIRIAKYISILFYSTQRDDSTVFIYHFCLSVCPSHCGIVSKRMHILLVFHRNLVGATL